MMLENVERRGRQGPIVDGKLQTQVGPDVGGRKVENPSRPFCGLIFVRFAVQFSVDGKP